MTQEKQLLLKDLCARLPYNIQGEGVYEDEVWHNGFPHNKKVTGHIEGIDHIGFDDEEIYVTIEGIQCELCDVKLYLRPMSSMTEEERNEYFSLKMQECERVALADIDRHEALSIILDWLNAHHFDHRNLIERGLALPAPEGMYD